MAQSGHWHEVKASSSNRLCPCWGTWWVAQVYLVFETLMLKQETTEFTFLSAHVYLCQKCPFWRKHLKRLFEIRTSNTLRIPWHGWPMYASANSSLCYCLWWRWLQGLIWKHTNIKYKNTKSPVCCCLWWGWMPGVLGVLPNRTYTCFLDVWSNALNKADHTRAGAWPYQLGKRCSSGGTLFFSRTGVLSSYHTIFSCTFWICPIETVSGKSQWELAALLLVIIHTNIVINISIIIIVIGVIDHDHLHPYSQSGFDDSSYNGGSFTIRAGNSDILYFTS